MMQGLQVPFVCGKIREEEGATEMKIELIKCFEAFAYCRSYGQEDFNLDPVYLLSMLESLENQIASLENK